MMTSGGSKRLSLSVLPRTAEDTAQRPYGIRSNVLEHTGRKNEGLMIEISATHCKFRGTTATRHVFARVLDYDEGQKE
jgi:hypothetical protein